MKTIRKGLFVILVILALAIPAQASTWSTGYDNADRAIALGIANDNVDLYATVTVGEFTDMLTRAFTGDIADSSNLPGADTPANIHFIKLAYENTTGLKMDEAPFWRFLSSGEYIATIEAINLIVQCPALPSSF